MWKVIWKLHFCGVSGGHQVSIGHIEFNTERAANEAATKLNGLSDVRAFVVKDS